LQTSFFPFPDEVWRTWLFTHPHEHSAKDAGPRHQPGNHQKDY